MPFIKNNKAIYIWSKRQQQGFTLLEVLIAVAIFSVVSLASFSIFDTVLSGEENSKIRNERLNELQRGFLLMERDFTQITRRNMRIFGETASETFLHTSEGSFTDSEQTIGFVRNGWTNPGMLLPRSDIQSVAYKLTDETLERLHYNFVDPVLGQEPRVRPLITGVTDLSIEYFSGGQWLEKWSGEGLPQAISIEIETLDYGVIRRKFLVAGDRVKAKAKT